MTSLELQLNDAVRRTDGGFLARVLGAFTGWKRRRAQRLALQDLAAFSPYLLNDLGITPGDIAALEQRAFAARRCP